ncbi:DUF4279 domain-containing protein [Paenibacillus profundus]|uniref:DUF4279 domain-containing protein n=1 Tax=Paenibacillus profundus TaxID=1173085 RepID=A0ABS8YRB5_9BACL|nr:DUF4279 domain-containing protein [Paenibacillus profundus]MCE5173714.1 DUF4279 domain-containing protein [Paenibacillus profundus]
MSLKGSCTLSFINCKYSELEINQIINLSATTVITKDQLVSKALNERAKHNAWLYKEKIQENNAPSDALEQLLSKLDIVKIQSIIDSCDEAFINLFLNTDYGQLGFELTPRVITLLSKLNLKLEIHVISFGRVE